MKKSDIAAWVFLAFTSLVIYSITICHTVYVGDSGELALAASQLQIAHPPGYPILTLLGRVWSVGVNSLLSSLRPILALNILGALLAALSTLVFYSFVKSLVGRPGVVARIFTVGMALEFSFSHVIWFHAVSFEVHTLASLLIVVALYSISRAISGDSSRYLILAAYATGLALANHLSSVALLPALLVVIIYRWRSLRITTLIYSGFALLVPITSYFFLWLRSRGELVLTWYNPQTWIGFKQQVFAEAYQRYIELISLSDIPAYFSSISGVLSQQFFLPWVIPAFIGFFVQFKRSRRLAIATLSILIVNIALNSNYGISDIEPYFLPTIIVLLVWLAELLAAVVSKTEFLSAAGALLSTAFAIAALVGNWSSCNLWGNHEAETYAQELFEQVPPGGILFCGSDNSTFATLYLRYAEGVRSDIEVYGQLPTLVRLQRDVAPTAGSGWGYFPDLLKATIENSKRSVVLTQELMNFDNDFRQFGLTLYPAGLVYQLSPEVGTRYLRSSLSLADKLPMSISDPKLAQLYAVYSLAAANRAFANKQPTAGKYLRQAEDIVSDQREPSLYSALAAYLIADDRLVQARRVAEGALTLSTLRTADRQRIYLALARTALRLEDIDDARAWLEKILEISPEEVEAKFQLLALDASEAVQQKAFAQAADLYLQMTQIAPDQLQSFYRLGTLRLQLGDTTAALAALQHCITNGYRSTELIPLVQSLSDSQ